MKPPPRPPDKMTQNDRQINLDLDLEINQDFEENSTYQEGKYPKYTKHQRNHN